MYHREPVFKLNKYCAHTFRKSASLKVWQCVRHCKELSISFARVERDFPPEVIDGLNIKVVESAKLLGLTISNDLTWNTHLTEVIKKASKRLYFLIQLKRANVSESDLVFTPHVYVPS